MDKTSAAEVLQNHGKWIGATAFTKLLAEKKNVSDRQARTDITKAYNKGQIKRHVFPDRTVIYGLDEFGPPTRLPEVKADEENVKEALQQIRHEYRFLKEPTIKEVACKIGITPATAEAILYALAPQTGWSEPDEKTKQEAAEAINLAGLLHAEKTGTLTTELKTRLEKTKATAPKRIQQITQNIQTNYPNLTPKIESGYLTWPQETQNQWRRIFGTQPPGPIPTSTRISVAFPKPNRDEREDEEDDIFKRYR